MWSRAADIKARARSLGGCGDAQAESRPPWVETRKEARACLPACLPACLLGCSSQRQGVSEGTGRPLGQKENHDHAGSAVQHPVSVGVSRDPDELGFPEVA